MPVREDHATQRERLLEIAATALEDGGPAALQTRRLTGELGASTQALYTLFGGMPALVEALAQAGYRELSAAVSAWPETPDPVADFLTRGWAYSRWALKHPNRYRLMFGLDLEPMHVRITKNGQIAGTPTEVAAFGVLTSSVQRMIDSGRIRSADPALVAGQFLATTHGYVLLQMGGAFAEDTGLAVTSQLAVNLLVGLGDRRARADRSLAAALNAHPNT